MAGPFGTLPSRFSPTAAATGLGIVLPGGNYSPSAPALEFARQALLQHGYAVQQVWWDRPDEERDWTAWVGERLAVVLAAEPVVPDRVLVVGKSLGTRAAPYASSRGYDAIWLTPLLDEPSCVEGIRTNPGRQLEIARATESFLRGL